MDVLHGFDYVFDSTLPVTQRLSRLAIARAISKKIITQDGAKWLIAEFSL